MFEGVDIGVVDYNSKMIKCGDRVECEHPDGNGNIRIREGVVSYRPPTFCILLTIQGEEFPCDFNIFSKIEIIG